MDPSHLTQKSQEALHGDDPKAPTWQQHTATAA
jgi:hypothetical protein